MRGWDTIPADELSAQSPIVDPNAHVEFTYRKLYVNDSAESGTIFSYHNRAKIFTEEGVKRWDKVDIPYATGWRVYGIRARVVLPDGSVAVLKSSDVHKRKVFKDDRFTGYAQSFSFPGLKPGCIIEYEWTERRAFWARTMTMPLRAEWPTWKFDLSIRPYPGMAYSGTSFYINAPWVKKGGRMSITVANQPAISDKPFLAARKDFEPWVYVEYAPELEMLQDEKYWNYRGGALVEVNKEFINPKRKAVKELANELFAGLALDEEKLKAAYDYCANEIVNIQEFTTKYTEQEIEDLKKNDSPADTIKNGYGMRYDINAVFASLAAAAGFSVHLAAVENHQQFTYRKEGLGGFNLSDWVVAIRYGENWRYFDPARSFLPFEVLDPENVDGTTIQTDKKYYYVHKTPKVGADFSVANRVADFSINEFGDLEGKVRIQYNGYTGVWRKRLFASMTESEQKDYIEEKEWKNRHSRATIDELVLRNADSRDKPLVVSYTVSIPGYADALPNRMLLRPSVFESGSSPLFPDEKRVDPIGFDYLFQVNDKISFTLPPGYAFDSKGSADGNFDGPALMRKSLATVDPNTGELVFRRSFEQKFTKAGMASYPIIKTNFDYLAEAEGRPVSLIKRKEEVAVAP